MVGPRWSSETDCYGGALSMDTYLEGVRALPTFPSVLFRFLGLLADPGVRAEQLADFLYKDPGLLARVIPLVNLSSSGESVPVGYWKQAIASLGRERIRNLAFTTPLLCSFEPLRWGFDPITYWERSLVCAHSCEALARQMGLPGPEQYYVAGLLHDIGYLLLLKKKPAALQMVIERLAEEPGDLLELESQVMGVDHCLLGYEVAGRLHLGPWIGRAIRDHHMPSLDSDWITRLTAISSAFCHYKGIDFFPSGRLPQRDRQRQMEQIIGELLPSLTREAPARLLAAMERTVESLKAWISETIVDFYQASNGPPQSIHFLKGKMAFAASMSRM